MHQAILTPFEQFAQNASGTTVGIGHYPYADNGIDLYAGLPRTGVRGLGDGLSGADMLVPGLLLLGVIGAGVFLFTRR